MSVVVFGSINIDLVVRAPHFPQPGESEIGSTFFTAPGGKGSNQAVACARLDIPTLMIGRVGNDVFGEFLKESLRKNNVDTQYIHTDSNQPCGTALITLNDAGENAIVYIPGANSTFGQQELLALEKACMGAKWLVLQLEIPMEVNLQAARVARENYIPIILDPAPAQPIPDEFYKWIEIITPNETEAAQLVGFPINDTSDACNASRIFLDKGCHQVVIKMGSKGAFYATRDHQQFIPAFKVSSVDTVAAGDAFNGALIAALHQGKPVDDALIWASATGALSTTKTGAQPSLPNRIELLNFLDREHH